jgi:hypothetical protein
MKAIQRGLLSIVCLSLAPVVVHDAHAAPRLAAVTGTTGVGTGLGSARLWAELGFHDQDAFTSLSSEVGFGLLLTQRLELEGVLPFAYASTPDPGGDDGFEIGNPYLGINLFDDRLRWSLGVALPLASEDDFGLPLLGALVTRGLQDIYLWEQDTFGLVGRLRAEAGNEIVVAFDGAAIVSIPTSDQDNRDVDVTLQPAGELIIRLTRPTSFGARLSLAWLLTREGDDDAQLALAPFLRHDFGSSFFTAQLLMNLDEPYGFAFDEGKVWGFFFGLGGAL